MHFSSLSFIHILYYYVVQVQTYMQTICTGTYLSRTQKNFTCVIFILTCICSWWQYITHGFFISVIHTPIVLSFDTANNIYYARHTHFYNHQCAHTNWYLHVLLLHLYVDDSITSSHAYHSGRVGDSHANVCSLESHQHQQSWGVATHLVLCSRAYALSNDKNLTFKNYITHLMSYIFIQFA